MYYRKQQIVEKINQISEERHSYDQKFMNMQVMINQHKKYEIVNLRKKFASEIQQLNKIVKDNHTVIDLLTYRCEKLAKDGIDLNNQRNRIQFLRQYFNEFKEKIRKESQRGQQTITARERWELTKYQGETGHHDQQQSLLNSHSAAKQTTQIARAVYENIANQSSRIEKTRQKMGDVLRNINFSGNLAQLMRTRTREDNRLIAMLSLGLVIWIIVCLFVLKPLYRGY